jgi:hypothetical protein
VTAQLFIFAGVLIRNSESTFSKSGGMIMTKFCLILIAACCSLAFASLAQDTTNTPKTEIENFEMQTGTVIVKGFGQAGSMTTGAGIISMRLKESIDVGHGRKQYGAVVELAANQQRELLIVDYDEMDSLLNGIDYLAKITYNATALPGFDAAFTTKSGLRISAHSERREGGIQAFLQFGDAPKIPLASDQLAQFQNLIAQAKSSLDALKDK